MLTLRGPSAPAYLLWCQLSSSPQEVYPTKLGCPALPGCCPHISPRPRCPGCPSAHHFSALPVARDHMRDTLSTPSSVWETALDMQSSPKAQGAELPILKQVLRCLQLCPCVQISAFSQNVRISHHTFLFLLQWEAFLPGMGGVCRRPLKCCCALLSSADAGSRHRMVRL